jgi:ribosomal protein S18 acetylase RimI-like enzyme
MSINIRRVSESDKERILQISSQIWGGDDYIPFVFDEWVKAKNSFFACAELEGKIAGFGRYVRITHDYIWLEGLRTDPAYQGRGVGKALTNFFIELGVKEGSKTLALSTYIDNRESIHIIEKSGFVKVAEFVYLEANKKEAPFKKEQINSIESIDVNSAEDFIKNSLFLKLSKGYFPYGWKFINARFGLKAILQKANLIIGLKNGGQIAGVAGGGEVIKNSEILSVFFIDGTEAAVFNLIKSVLNLMETYHTIEFMVPILNNQSIPAFDVLKKLEINNYNKYIPDVFVYEKSLTLV